MIDYKLYINSGVEAFGTDGKTITANEDLKTVDESALAREIAHQSHDLIPENVAAMVLQNFCKAAAEKMSEGFAIVLKSGQDAALRIYPDIHLKGDNINLDKAKELMPDVVIDEATMVEHATELADKVGVTMRVKAESEIKFTELLKSIGASIQRTDVVEKAKVARVNDTEESGSSNTQTNPSSGDDSGNGFG